MVLMEKIHTADDPIFIGYLKSLLDAADIACHVRNELLIGGSGELPPNECWPELWVLHDEDAGAARAIVAKATRELQSDGAPWECAACGEQSEAQFQACWRCGANRS